MARAPAGHECTEPANLFGQLRIGAALRERLKIAGQGRQPMKARPALAGRRACQIINDLRGPLQGAGIVAQHFDDSGPGRQGHRAAVNIVGGG